MLPAKGEGYITYNNDGNDHYGTVQTIKAIKTIAVEWKKTHPNSPLQIGDMSRKGGGSFEPIHKSHRNGTDADIRPFRNDGRNVPLNIKNEPKGYNREKTRQLIVQIKQNYPNAVILFNDSVFIKEGLTKHAAGHDNHLHVKFK